MFCQVSKETIEKKLHKFEIILPVYYGWFCDENSGTILKNLCQNLFGNAKKFQRFPDIWKYTSVAFD